ncbi:ribonuclease R [Blattabacterium sp. (Cryptocercus punctulatus) str. Cpu]|uniref:ribonuclease R n=1 Tax=Blattabacterium sp. (Cryptocercus punctulatus) str. Cpu TaxID=1075399 RepID=UPI00023872F0|nr:ribonuclease R [Blattabacterium sp. (Cryptocercus punctulatus) str. Cpu]AEU09323.1 ribonuclease R [Blattabacterium sp. (Cryptocercus punctulatus) str. Cpu]
MPFYLEKKKKKYSIEKKNQYRNLVTVTGLITITNYGYAFVNVEEFQKLIFIPKKKTNRAIEGDLVRIKIKNKKLGKKMEGEVIKIIKRNRENFIGVLKIKSNSRYGLVIVYNKTIHVNIYIPKKKLKGYHPNEKVLVRIITWPKNLKNPLGEIIKVFGQSGEYTTEIYSLLEEYGLSYEFSKEVEKEAKKIVFKKNLDNNLRRRDMRNINTFTIDPFDAKDFDDALSIRKLNYNTWEIGIHIADVTYYIKEGSLLDKEAYTRSNSIYFIGKSIPMLPKILSNDICSLHPEKDKLSFSSIFNVDSKGKILKSWFGKTIIRSNRRFTYEEVQKIIEKKRGDFHKDLYTLFTFSKIFTKNRLKNGSIYLDKVEIKIHLDEKKNPYKLDLEKNNEAHRLIEEFMLLANRKISEFVSLNLDGNPSNKTYIYRIHDKPDFQKIFILKKIIEPLGYSLDLKNLKKSLNGLLKNIQGKSEQNMIENLILRSMSKAKYSTNNIGHYGLSFIYYSHFTSPIRRYSDIIAHRLLNYYLTKNNESKLKSLDFYEKQAVHCSYKERLSIDAEREFSKYIQVKYIKKFLGKEFDGIITGFTDWSVFIDLLSFQTEGMVRLRDIEGDIYTLNSNNYSIIGKKKRKIYHLGDKVKVKLLDANIEKKQIILEWLDT